MVKPDIYSDGFMYRIYKNGYFNDDPKWFNENTSDYTGISLKMNTITDSTNNIIIQNHNDNYSIEWFGYFYAPVSGDYTFYIASHDASYLWIGSPALNNYTTGNYLIYNGGLHDYQEEYAMITLSEGEYYPIRIQYGKHQVPCGGSDFQFSFIRPNGRRTFDVTGYLYAPIGLTQEFPALSAKYILDLSINLLEDGIYYILLNGASMPIYCLMDPKWDGGGWMMLMKATRGTTFQFSSPYWTNKDTSLNTNDTTRNDRDAKYHTMNYSKIKDLLVTWPDVGYKGGSLINTDTWTWLLNDWYSASRITFLDGIQTDKSRYININNFSGFSSIIWSHEDPNSAFIIGGTRIVKMANKNVRLGFVWSETDIFNSINTFNGIGMDNTTGYSAGDWRSELAGGYAGLNRSMRVEIYGR
jgi:hypothetical protein